MTVTPESLANSGSETGHQRAFFCWLIGYNGLIADMTFAIPNGGSRGDPVSAKIRGANLKAEGVKAGVPDIFVAWPRKGYAGLFIEMKKPGKGVVSNLQIVWHKNLAERQYKVTVCYSWKEAANAVAKYFERDLPFTISL